MCFNCFAFFSTVAHDSMSLMISRSLLTHFCNELSKLPDVISKRISDYTLEKLQPRVISFEEQVGYMRCSF